MFSPLRSGQVCNKVCVCVYVRVHFPVFSHLLCFSVVDFPRWLSVIHPPVRFIASHLAHNFTSPSVSVQQYHSWPLMLSRQTWPSCLVIRSEDLHRAYQSAPPADYLCKKKEQRPKPWTQRPLDQAFPRGQGRQCAPSREKVSKCHMQH